MADVSSIKPYGTGGASYNLKDATARSAINGLNTRVTALENAPSGVNIYRVAGPSFGSDEFGAHVNGRVCWDSENRTWVNDYDDTSFNYVPVTSLMSKYPNTAAPSVNVGDILIYFDEGYGSIRTVLAVMNSATVPAIIQNCINANPDATAAEKTAFFNSIKSAYNTYGTLLITGTGSLGAGVFGYFYEG